VNLGIGIPTLVGGCLTEGSEIIFHSENGLLGMGPAPAFGEADGDLIDAGKNPVTVVPGGCYMSQVDSFALIRGGHLDLAVLGAFQVSGRGDLANWANPGEVIPAVGGAMDLVVGARDVWVAMKHTTPGGAPKLVETCTYPLTGRGVVGRVYTDLAVFDVNRDTGVLEIREVVAGLTIDKLRSQTGVSVRFGSTSAAVNDRLWGGITGAD
jgi:3-oxoacid CoA-transferase B subunit